MAEPEVLTKEECLEISRECFADPVLFCGTFLKHWFPSPMPWVHRGLLAILTLKTDFLLKYGELDKIERHFVYHENPVDPKSPLLPLFIMHRDADGEVTHIDIVAQSHVLVMMPRGFSKTTLCNASTLYDISYHECDFPLYVSETGNHAKMQMGNVKRELESNSLLIAVFGNKVPSRTDGQKWTEDMIETLDGITVVARGQRGQVRGLQDDGKRPDKIIVDDLEDKESVSTTEQRKKTSSWFFSDLLPVLTKLKPGSRMIMIGTLLHQGALLLKLMRDPTFTSCRFAAIDLDGDPLWAANMDIAKLEKLKSSYSLAGELPEFYMEYMSILRDENTSKFRREFFFYDMTPKLIVKSIALDPAIGEERENDEACIGVVGMTEKGKIHVCDLWGKRGAAPREQIDQYFQMVTTHTDLLQYYGVESNAFQKALVHLMQEEMFRRKRYFEITKIMHSTAKTARINGVLQPRYSAGYVTHQRIFPELEEQLLDFPNGVHDDRPDVIAMAVALLDPQAAQVADDDLTKDQFTDEDDTDQLLEGYRCAP